MMKKKMRKMNRRNRKLIAAAVLSAALISGQMLPAFAESRSTAIEKNSIFPDNITIETPVPLSEISLPKCEYGKLSWADDTQVPSRRSEAFEVIFRPTETFDLSRIDGWDGESDKMIGYVTVVVSSIEASEEESTGTEYSDTTENGGYDNSETAGEEVTSGDTVSGETAAETENTQEQGDNSQISGEKDSDVQEGSDTRTGETLNDSEEKKDSAKTNIEKDIETDLSLIHI